MPERRPVIAVSGSNKDVGKSSLAARVIARLRVCAAAKFSVHGTDPEGEPIVEERDPGKDNDTSRMLRAGARPVLWVRSTHKTLPRLVEEVLRRTEGLPLVVEGNSVLEHLRCDYVVFVMGPGFEDFKPSAWEALRRADTVLVNGSAKLAPKEALRLEREIKGRNPRAKVVFAAERGEEASYSIILSRMAGRIGGGFFVEQSEEKVVEALKKKAEEGRIACADALRLAEELGVPPLEVGKAANELNIKIVRCSLGCF
jgi:predicted GTPase